MRSLAICALVVLSMLGAMLTVTGCKGPDPVGLQVGQALDDGFAAIRPDAELGLRVRSDPVLAQAAGVQPISASMAQYAGKTLDYHAEIIGLVKQRAKGTEIKTIPDPPQQ